MNYSVLLHPRTAGFLEKAESQLRQTIKDELRKLEDEPLMGKRLSGSQYYRLRIGDYRAIYEVNHAERKILVQFIGHRKNIYDDFSKLLR